MVDHPELGSQPKAPRHDAHIKLSQAMELHTGRLLTGHDIGKIPESEKARLTRSTVDAETKVPEGGRVESGSRMESLH